VFEVGAGGEGRPSSKKPLNVVVEVVDIETRRRCHHPHEPPNDRINEETVGKRPKSN
jgi:hypothetical protein